MGIEEILERWSRFYKISAYEEDGKVIVRVGRTGYSLEPYGAEGMYRLFLFDFPNTQVFNQEWDKKAVDNVLSVFGTDSDNWEKG